MQVLINKLISFTETILTIRKKSKSKKEEKYKKMHPARDWIGSFLWAAGVVLIVNQYLFQAYVIPSTSMERTLAIKDRLFVNKFLFGPEILPGIGKIDRALKPGKSDVVIFENPEYKSRGALFDITQRLIFMLTLSMIDIDMDENGNPAHHFLIKRIVANNGEIVKLKNGELYIKPQGGKEFLHEMDYMAETTTQYYYQRLINPGSYTDLRQFSRKNVYYNSMKYGVRPNNLPSNSDEVEIERLNNKYLSQVSPSNINYYLDYNKTEQGHYIPEGWVLTLGDNRDRSHDGRFFGPIKESEVLGKASVKFWPLNRIGEVR